MTIFRREVLVDSAVVFMPEFLLMIPGSIAAKGNAKLKKDVMRLTFYGIFMQIIIDIKMQI